MGVWWLLMSGASSVRLWIFELKEVNHERQPESNETPLLLHPPSRCSLFGWIGCVHPFLLACGLTNPSLPHPSVFESEEFDGPIHCDSGVRPGSGEVELRASIRGGNPGECVDTREIVWPPIHVEQPARGLT